MDRIISDFINITRRAGVRISPSESIEAFQALSWIGYEDRNLLKDSLNAILAKSQPEKEILERCFDRFFSLDGLSDTDYRPKDIKKDALAKEAESLSELLIREDQVALATAMRMAAREEQLEKFRLPTQKSLLTRRILEQMGISTVNGDIRSLQEKGTPSGQSQAATLREARDELAEYVKQYVSRQIDLQKGDLAKEMMEENLRNAKLSQIEQNQFRLMHEIILRLAKKLNDNLSRRLRASNRGHLDFKHTLRDNVTYQGLLFDTKWKNKKIERPDVVVICDVSKSVMRTVRFLLLILYSLNKTMVRVRSFIFCSNLMEVTELFKQYPVAEAIHMIQNSRELPIIMGRTDYDQAFRDFHEKYFSAVNRRTTIIILGDARNNNGNPRIELLKEFYERCRRLIWLNPEGKPFWGSGDSEIKRYMPYCHTVRECNTLAHLERVVRAAINSR